MELPFAVETPAAGGAGNRVVRNDASQHSDSGSLVTASSQGSFMDTTDDNLDIPLVPNTPQDILLRAPHRPQEQGQIVVIPAPEEQGIGDAENDFTYVNVTEIIDTDEDGPLIEGDDMILSQDQKRGDVLAVLLGEMQQNNGSSLLNETEYANEMALKASEAKKQGDLLSALDHHTQAAKLYKDIAVAIRDKNAPLASSLLLLSQTQAKSAIALKSIVKLKPTELRQILPPGSKDSSDEKGTSTMSQKDRLRAVVRGALSSKHPHEEDLSASQFLGRADKEGKTKVRSPLGGNDKRNSNRNSETRNDQEGTLLTAGQDNNNPVDEMMELERELRDMDMALELGNSIASLDVRTQNRMKNSMIGDGSFMVVPPGSSSYMSSSIWGGGHNTARQGTVAPNNQYGTAGVRARANRVQNILDAHPSRPAYQQQPQIIPPQTTSNNKNSSGLDASWWGANNPSQVLSSSVMSLGGGRAGMDGVGAGGQSSGNTKQIMRLMDSLKTLTDENESLLREIDDLSAARAEAKAAREAMKTFKNEYGKRFSHLKNALEKFRQENLSGKNTTHKSPVNTSEFMNNAALLDQIQRQEQMIQKLTRDLKKEKEESKKKDSALRKYESFYRDIKARSAQKAAQRQTQQQRQNAKPPVRSVPARPPSHR